MNSSVSSVPSRKRARVCFLLFISIFLKILNPEKDWLLLVTDIIIALSAVAMCVKTNTASKYQEHFFKV